jgi:hypothetical protein
MKRLIEYLNSNQTQGLLVNEECFGVLYVEPTGMVDLETASRLMSLVGEYSQAHDVKVVLLVDNSKVTSIEPEARSYVLNLLKKRPFIQSAVSFGSNVFIRNFMNIFLGLMTSGAITAKVFKTKDEALEHCRSSCPDRDD